MHDRQRLGRRPFSAIAAEANHEKDRRRQKRLDQAVQAVQDVVDQP